MSKYNYSILIAILGLVSLYLFKDFILPILMGGIGSIVLYRPTRILNTYIKNYKLSALLVGFIGTGVFLFPLGFVLLSGTGELISFLQKDEIIPQIIQLLNKTSPLFQKIAPFIPPQKIEEYSELIFKFVNAKILTLLQSMIIHFPNLLMELIITLASSYSFLVAAPYFKKTVNKFSVFTELQYEKIHTAVISITQSVVVASLISGLLQALIMGIITSIILPEKILLVSVLIFFFSFLPIVNTLPVTGSLLFWTFQGIEIYPIVLVIIGMILLLIIELVIRPWLIGNKSKIHPLVALLSALGGLSTLGFYGLFLGPIIVGVLFNLVSPKNEVIKQ